MTNEDKMYLIIAMYQPERRYKELLLQGEKMYYPLLQGSLKGFKIESINGLVDLNESIKFMERAPIEMIKGFADDIIFKHKSRGLSSISLYLENEDNTIKPIKTTIPLL